MKAKKLLTLTLLPLMMLTSCGNKIDPEYGPDEEVATLTAPSNVISKYKQGNEDHLSKAESTTKYVRIHYRRKDDTENNRAVYEPWNIWGWDMTNGGNGDAYDFTHYDNYGVYVDLDLSVIGGGKTVSTVGFIVRTDNWAKDPDGDRSIEVNPTSKGGIQDVYVKTNDSTIFDSANNALKSTISSVIMESFTEASVYFKPITSGFKAYPKRLGVKVNDVELTSGFHMGEYDESKKKVSVTFDKPIDLSDKVEITYKFDSEWVASSPLMCTSYFDTNEFKTNFSYKGNDLGATFDNVVSPTKTTFKVWAPTSKSVKLKVYNSGDYVNDNNATEYAMTKGEKGVYQYTVNENLDGKYYTYEVTNSKGTNEVVDPYAKSAGVNGRRGMVVNFDKLNKDIPGWNQDQRSTRYGNNNVDASIYEMHVRDMTINPNSGVDASKRGKFLGMAQEGTTYTENGKTVTTGLDHIKELGVSHVQIQPFYDYSSVDESKDTTKMSNDNYNWGYDPQNYNVLEGSYSTNAEDGYARIREFKQMVMAMHNADININMDVVYNHTSASENSNFNLLVPYYYYRTYSSGRFYNGSGCGNEIASDRFMVNKFIRESTKFWTEEYHLSGYRFDLMGLLDNQTMIDVYNDNKAIDPNIMVYGEPWTGGSSKLKQGTDASKLTSQQTVQSSLAQDYFSGNNVLVGAFNNVIRNAVRGDNNLSKGFVQGLYLNAKDIEAGVLGTFSQSDNKTKSINPNQVINYVACHDNYTLADQIKLTMKDSYRDSAYTQAESLVFLSEGVPFLQEGEEFLRSKMAGYDEANNSYEKVHNSYNAGDYVNNMDYSLKITNEAVNDKFKELIQFRKDNAEFRLATREAINNGVKVVEAKSGIVSYTVGDFYVIHTAKNASFDLGDTSYDIVFANSRENYSKGISGNLELNANETVVLKKAA